MILVYIFLWIEDCFYFLLNVYVLIGANYFVITIICPHWADKTLLLQLWNVMTALSFFNPEYIFFLGLFWNWKASSLVSSMGTSSHKVRLFWRELIHQHWLAGGGDSLGNNNGSRKPTKLILCPVLSCCSIVLIANVIGSAMTSHDINPSIAETNIGFIWRHEN